MRLSFNVKINLPRELEKKSIEIAKSVLWKAMNRMEMRATQMCPVDTGSLQQSIKLRPTYKGATEYTLTDGVEYGAAVEFGSKPHYAPIKPLKGWSRRQLKNQSAAYKIQAHIAKKGTKEHPFFRPALFEVKHNYIPKLQRQIFGYFRLIRTTFKYLK